MPIELNQIYYKKPNQAPNVKAFYDFMNGYPELDFYFPSEKAPWHVAVIVERKYKVHVNFWPHVLKAQADGDKVHQGRFAFMDAMEDALNTAMDDADVVDAEDVW